VQQGDDSVVWKLFDAIAAKDRLAALDVLHPEVAWYPTVWSGASSLHGKEAVGTWFDQFGPGLERLRIEVESLRVAEGWVIALGTVFDTRGAQFTTRVGWNFAVEDGLIVEGRAYVSWDEAEEAAGRPPTG
jgi:ketosteroid isomerase-like protein